MADIKKPNTKFELVVDGEPRTILMSFALFQEIMKVIPRPQDIASLLITDFYLREYIVRRVLTGNKRIRDDADLIDLFEVEIDPASLDDLTLWVTDHILYFFTSTVERSMGLGKKYQAKMIEVTQSAQSRTGSPQ